MAGLDPREGPEPDHIHVTREYLEELYGKIEHLKVRCAYYETMLEVLRPSS